jgi:hypothetical protein
MNDDAKKEAKQNAEWDKIRGDIKVNQALSKQKSKDLDARQDTLPGFRGESRDNPNRAEMERRAIADQDAKAAEREARKAAKSGGKGGDDVQKYIDEIPKRKAEAEQRMKDYKEGNAKSMEQFNANMQKIGDTHDAKMKELRNTTKSGGSGGGGGVPKTGLKKPLDMKKGGMVSSASKRADGIAIRGKTRA